jgi:hypothetical protein
MIPRLVKITQCTLPGAWYEHLHAEEYVVLAVHDGYYVVATFDGYNNCIPSLIKICDCRVIMQ